MERFDMQLGKFKTATFWLLFLAVISAQIHAADRSPYDWALVRLDYVRDEKVEQLQRLCDRLHDLAGRASDDESLIAFFDMNLQYFLAQESESVPESMDAEIEKLRKQFNRYYVENYFAFYDILFISRQGDIFYTFRKEADIFENLLMGSALGSPLGRCLATRPEEEAFVDYHLYLASDEPAAFFVEPIYKDTEHIGWMALQSGINKINSLFASTEDMGQTGETFLVNQEGFMLTESHFEGTPTILNKRLADKNIQAKFAEERGHRTVTDYRGSTALTSFEVFPFSNTKWLVVAKIDKDEITTQHYMQHKRYYADQLLEYIKKSPPAPLKQEDAFAQTSTLRIDMDEFLKAEDSELLETWGVSSCTALIAAFPGRFAYMAHVSPKDRLYGGGETNLLGQMAKKITYFDIRPYERLRMVFVVIAPHLDSLPSIVEELVKQGFLLSQIRVAYCPGARRAAVVYDYEGNRLRVAWKMSDEQTPGGCHRLDDTFDVGRLIQEMLESEIK